MRWSIALAVVALGAAGCKKKVPLDAPAEVPVETPSPSPASGGDGGDGSASADPAPVTPTPAPAGNRLHDQVNEAIKDLETTDVARNRAALERLEALKTQHPDSGIVELNIGVAQQRLGNTDAARTAWQGALAKDPSLGNAYLFLGGLDENNGDLKGAEARYRAGIAADPENVDVRVGMVSTLRKQGRTEEALAEAQRALKLNTMSTEIYNDVGLAYLERGDTLLAKFMYQKALDIPGGEEKAYLQANLGWAYYKEGKLPQATFRLKKAVELDPEYVPGLVYLARVYMEDHNYADTVDLLERAAKHAPQNHGVQMNLGIAYRGVGRLEDAKKAYERALVIEPANPDPHFNLGVLYADYLKEYDTAVSKFGLYKSSGGKQIALADEYIADVEREKAAIERRAKQMEASAKRDSERKERERLAAEEEARLKAVKPDPEPTPTPEVVPAPAPEAPAPEAPAPDAPAPESPAPESPAPDGGN